MYPIRRRRTKVHKKPTERGRFAQAWGQAPSPRRSVAVKPRALDALASAEGTADNYPFRPDGAAGSAGFQRSGSSSSIRLFGCVLTRASTSRR